MAFSPAGQRRDLPGCDAPQANELDDAKPPPRPREPEKARSCSDVLLDNVCRRAPARPRLRRLGAFRARLGVPRSPERFSPSQHEQATLSAMELPSLRRQHTRHRGAWFPKGTLPCDLYLYMRRWEGLCVVRIARHCSPLIEKN